MFNVITSFTKKIARCRDICFLLFLTNFVTIRDIYLAQLAPLIWEFGHVRETPDDWEQRFEKIDAGEHTHRGKVFKPTKTLCFSPLCLSLSLLQRSLLTHLCLFISFLLSTNLAYSAFCKLGSLCSRFCSSLVAFPLIVVFH